MFYRLHRESNDDGDRSKTIETMRGRYLYEYRRIYAKNDRIRFFEEISEMAAAESVSGWKIFADAMSAWLRKDLSRSRPFRRCDRDRPHMRLSMERQGQRSAKSKASRGSAGGLREGDRAEPEYADPWNGKGNVLQSQQHNEEAIKAFEKAVALMTSKGITS